MFINQDFQNGITQQAPSVVFRLTFDDITISNENYLIKADLEFICDSFVGELPSWKLGATFLYDNAVSYINREFFLEIGVYDSTHTIITWMPFKNLVVSEDGQQTDEITRQITITAFDYVSKLDKQYKPLELPLTGRGILEELVSRNDIELSVDFPNLPLDNYIFNSLNIGVGSPISDRSVIREYLTANVSFGFSNRENKLHAVTVFSAVPLVSESISFEFDTYGFKLEKDYGPINAVVYGNRAGGADESYQEVYARDETSIEANGLKELKIFDNVFLDLLTEDEKQEIIDTLLTVVDGYIYSPFELDMFARPDFDPGDIIELENSEGNKKYIPLTNMTFTYNGGLVGSLRTLELPETLTNYLPSGSNQRAIETEIRVNKAEGEITLLVQATDENKQEISLMKQSIEGFEFELSKTGGTNLIFNSGFRYEMENWFPLTYKIPTLVPSKSLAPSKMLAPSRGRLVSYDFIRSIETGITKTKTRSGFAGECFDNGLILSKAVRPRGGTEHYITLKVFNNNPNAVMKIYLCEYTQFISETEIINNGIEPNTKTLLFNIAKNSDYEEFTTTLYTTPEMRQSHIMLEVENMYVNTGYIYISDILFKEGSIAQNWEQASGEIYSGSVAMNGDRLAVGNSASGIQTQIRNTGLYILNDGNVVMQFDQNTTVMQKTRILDDVWVAESLRFHKRSDGSIGITVEGD